MLDVSNNRLKRVGSLSGTPQLTDLWVNDNEIESLDEVEESLAAVKDTLTCLYLSNNPAAQVNAYKLRVLAAAPKLEQLDGNVIQGRG